MSEQPHGSVGEEAAKLAEAVQDWLGEWRGSSGFGGFGRLGGGARDVWAEATAPSHDSTECRMCPICQGLRLLRGVQPEVFEHLSDAATSLAAALRALAADAGGPAPRDPSGPSGVEHIDLG